VRAVRVRGMAGMEVALYPMPIVPTGQNWDHAVFLRALWALCGRMPFGSLTRATGSALAGGGRTDGPGATRRRSEGGCGLVSRGARWPGRERSRRSGCPRLSGPIGSISRKSPTVVGLDELVSKPLPRKRVLSELAIGRSSLQQITRRLAYVTHNAPPLVRSPLAQARLLSEPSLRRTRLALAHSQIDL
jgi:hypothetical protein